MFGSLGSTVSEGNESGARALLEIIAHPDKARQALDHLVAERKKNDKTLAEMRAVNENIVRQQAEAAKARKEADELKTEYDTKVLAFEAREKTLRDGFAQLEVQRAELHQKTGEPVLQACVGVHECPRLADVVDQLAVVESENRRD